MLAGSPTPLHPVTPRDKIVHSGGAITAMRRRLSAGITQVIVSGRFRAYFKVFCVETYVEIADSWAPEPRKYLEFALQSFRSYPNAMGNRFDIVFYM